MLSANNSSRKKTAQPSENHPSLSPAEARTEAWVSRAQASWNRSLKGLLAAGQALLSAKPQLPPGTFTNLITNELAFCASVARQLMAVAADGRFLQHDSSALPRNLDLLYRLRRLSDDALLRASSDGTVCPEMRLADVPKVSRNQSAKPPRRNNAEWGGRP